MHGTYVRHDRVHERRCVVFGLGDGVIVLGLTDRESWTSRLDPLCKHLTDCREDRAGTLSVGIAVSE